ncbi:MAG: porin family protein [Alphaproteobacteria bacterium]|nr:porin family protein [Alphaproteobacteria bacterium]
MKKYLLSTLAIAGLFGVATTANAADDGLMTMNMSNPYAVMQAGMGFGSNDYKESAVFALGAGYHMNQFLKSDITVGMRAWGKLKKQGHSADVWTIPALANLYMTMPYKKIEPYIMGGIGMAWNMVDNTHLTKGDDKMSFAWTAGAGIGYRLSHCWGLDLGYRYVDLGEGRSKFKDGSGRIKKDVKSHDVILSARYYF